MYRLKFIPDRKVYQIHSRTSGAFEGNLWEIKQKACQMGLESREFDMAVHEMIKYGHSVAEFGIYGKFIFTKPR